jgi:hypothetical protein
MNVLLVSPGFPAEMPHFARGLAHVGAKVLGIGDSPLGSMAEDARASLSDYLQVQDLWNEAATVQKVREWVRGRTIDRVECLWEPGMILAAKVRQNLGCPGLTVEQTVPFRDKEAMKQKLDAAGVRTPRHARCRTKPECLAAAERLGYPLIIKPIAGAGSADTYPLREPKDMQDALAKLAHIDEVSVEEFIEGEEHTFDTISASGEILFHNVGWYLPKPLVARLNPWISAQNVILRDTSTPPIMAGRRLGAQVLAALEFRTGFTHMEWFRTPKGEAVFGEIGARPPGARLVHAMNFACDADFFSGWAEAVCFGRLSQPTEKKYNVVLVFKRAEGEGVVRRIEGLESLLARYGEHVVNVELTRVGEPKKDWRKVVIGDGWIACRHPDLESTLEMGARFATDLRLYAS